MAGWKLEVTAASCWPPDLLCCLGFWMGMGIGEGKPLAVHLLGCFSLSDILELTNCLHFYPKSIIWPYRKLVKILPKTTKLLVFCTLIFLEKWVLSLMAKQMIKNFEHQPKGA
jgi:hypothetical protein